MVVFLGGLAVGCLRKFHFEEFGGSQSLPPHEFLHGMDQGGFVDRHGHAVVRVTVLLLDRAFDVGPGAGLDKRAVDPVLVGIGQYVVVAWLLVPEAHQRA